MSNYITVDREQTSHCDVELKFDMIVDAPLNAKDFSSRIEDLPVSTRSLINRDTELKNLKKITKSRGGFDGNLWQPPRAARIRGTDEVYIFDGDHSKHLFCLAYPDAETMPVQVIEVEREEDIHKLFVATNKTSKTAITAEQVFVHNVHANEPKEMNHKNALDYAGLKIYCSGEARGTVGPPDGQEIKYSDLKRCCNTVDDLEVLKEAKELIMSCDNPLGKDRHLPGSILLSLCQMLSAYPALRANNECGAEFKEWFVDMVGRKTPARYGSDVQRDCRSGFSANQRMAAGIVQDINNFQKDNPGTFAAVSKGAYKRISSNDLKLHLKNRRPGTARKSASDKYAAWIALFETKENNTDG
ncbi:MAG TPA: hypothetical protein DHV30_00525 [Balneola sp.]|nr:hypothetical protein [Balneola sp.]